MDTRLTPLEKTEKPISIAAEVARLARMTVPDLRARHEELFGGAGEIAPQGVPGAADRLAAAGRVGGWAAGGDPAAWRWPSLGMLR